jgi:hypothetical protein
MRIQVQELTPGCGEWCACLFDRFGEPLFSAKSTVSAQEAENRLEDELRSAYRIKYGSSQHGN